MTAQANAHAIPFVGDAAASPSPPAVSAQPRKAMKAAPSARSVSASTPKSAASSATMTG
jgi:hypothetical protein